MTDRLLSIVPPTGGRTVTLVGDIYRVLVTAKETDGKYSLVETVVPPGGGPPPHKHSREEEGFYILEGEIAVTVDGRREILKPGMFANLPIGSVHSFRNEGTTAARMLILLAPGGFEEMFLEAGQPVTAGTTKAPPPTRQEIDRLLSVAAKYGIDFMLPK